MLSVEEKEQVKKIAKCQEPKSMALDAVGTSGDMSGLSNREAHLLHH